MGPAFFLHLATKMVAARDTLQVRDWRSFSREYEKSKREEIEDKYKELSKKYDLIDKEFKSLKKTNGDSSNDITEKEKEIENLNNDIKKKDKEIAALNSKVEDLETEKKALNSEMDNLKVKIEELMKEPAQKTDETVSDDETIVISRISNTEFESSSFTSTRYKVGLSRDCRIMTFKLDILGSATCINGIIKLPLVANYVQFTGKKDYQAEITDDGAMLIRL